MSRVNFIVLLAVLAAAEGGVLKDDINTRIVNGQNVTEGEIPYQVSLQRIVDSHHFCGGSVLNENYVITAAHCVFGKSASDIKVVAGTIHLNKPQAVHQALNIRIHREYNSSNSFINDIALIKIATPFKYSKTVSPVKLPKANTYHNADEIAVVSGWGRLFQNGPVPITLQKVEVNIADQEYCRNVYAEKYLDVYKTQICAHDPTVEHGSCQGDSGGPLTIDGVLVGLVSWAVGCARIYYPTVYTRVSSYIDWIQNNTV